MKSHRLNLEFKVEEEERQLLDQDRELEAREKSIVQAGMQTLAESRLAK